MSAPNMQGGARRRPLGVTILAALVGIGAVLAVLVSVGLLLGLIDASIASSFGMTGAMSSTALGVGLLIYTAAGLVFAFGAWTLRSWGWVLGIIFFAGSALSDALAGLLGFESVGSAVVQVVVGFLVLYYWLRPSVRAAFGRGVPTQ